jgi:hypothetical protein
MKRSLSDDYPATFQFDINIKEKNYSFQLTQDKEFFSPKYKEYEMDSQGNLKVVKTSPTLCHYLGHSTQEEVSGVRVSRCRRGIDGTFYIDNEKWIIEPATASGHSSDEADHYVFRAHETLKRNVDAASCGVADMGEFVPQERRESASMKRQAGTKEIKWVEYLIMNDKEHYNKNGTNTTLHSQMIVHETRGRYYYADFIYDIRIVLVGQITVTTSNPFSTPPLQNGEVDHQVLLSSFSTYCSTASLPSFDNIGLYSGLDFLGNTVGYAWVSGMCDKKKSYHIVQMTYSYVFDGTTTAHEMGHNFGMSHDASPCSNTAFIMASIINIAQPALTWSTCSKSNISTFFNTYNPTCLDNVPVSSTDKFCGNGYVDIGEQCDCYNKTSCDTCCDSSTCKFSTGSVCTSLQGACCVSCVIAPQNTVCRTAQLECELNTVCNGNSPSCLPTYKPNGTPCSNSGTCYNGICNSLVAQCNSLEGIFNKQGETSTNWVPCTNHGAIASQQQEDYCAVMYCASLNSPGSCVYFPGTDTSKMYVANGIPCPGTNKLCINAVCTDKSTIPTTPSPPSGTTGGSPNQGTGANNSAIITTSLLMILFIISLYL